MNLKEWARKLYKAARALEDVIGEDLFPDSNRQETHGKVAIQIHDTMVQQMKGKKHASNGRNRPGGFTDRERQVMRVLRSRGPMLGRDVIAAIGIPNGKGTHIYKILSRLEDRKLVRQLKNRQFKSTGKEE